MKGGMESPIEQQTRGQELYRRKDYTGALQCFDEVWSVYRGRR